MEPQTIALLTFTFLNLNFSESSIPIFVMQIFGLFKDFLQEVDFELNDFITQGKKE